MSGGVVRRILAALALALGISAAHAGNVTTQSGLNSEIGTTCAGQNKSSPCITPTTMQDLIVSTVPAPATNITAAGSTQGTATPLTAGMNVVATVAAGTGVILQTPVPGQRIDIVNNGANPLTIYPPSGDTIDLGVTNQSVTLAVNSAAEFLAATTTSYYTISNPSLTIPNPTPAGFYVSPSGNDSNAGTLALPFLTLGKCQTAMQASPNVKTCFLRAGTYSMSSGLVLTSQDVNETWTFYPADGVNSPKLTQTSAFRFFTIETGADQVTINGLTATGFEAVSGLGSCTGTQAQFIDGWVGAANNAGPNNLTVTNNILSQFDCGILLLENANPVVSFNQITNIGYAAIVGDHVTGSATQSVWQGNILYDLDPNVAPGGPNSYGIVFSTTSNGQSSNVTVLNNQAYNCHTWTCFNTHGGTNIFFQNNLAVFSGSLGANTSNYSFTPAGSPYTQTNTQVLNNIADNGANGSTLNATAFVLCGVGGCSPHQTSIVSCTISGNTSLFGTANGTQIYSDPVCTVSSNTGSLNPETVSSINFTGGLSSASGTHGQSSAVIATLSVNMSNTVWAFPFPPGTLSVGGTNSGGFVICNSKQLCQSGGGTAAGTYSDFSIIATLHGMNGSPVTGAAVGALTVTMN